MPLRSAEAAGSKYFLQFLFAAAASASCLPLIKAIGVGWASTVCTTPFEYLITNSGFRRCFWGIHGVLGDPFRQANARVGYRRGRGKREVTF